MTARFTVPRKSIYRLSVYSRCLKRLADNGVETVSSETLAKAAGVKPAQLRKDLTHLDTLDRNGAAEPKDSPLGRRGLGYNVATLIERLDCVLGKNRLLPVVLVGVGNLGSALMRYRGFAPEGFEIIGAFDCDTERPRSLDVAVPIRPMADLPVFARDNKIRLAMLAVPADAAQSAAQFLADAGIQGILNFSGAVLELPDTVMVNNVNLAIELENLAYFVK